MEQSLAAEKMNFSSELMTRQVIGSLCPLNSLISEASGGMSCKRDKRKSNQSQFVYKTLNMQLRD